MFALENILYVLISQAQQIIIDNTISPAEIYHLRRELGTELVSNHRVSATLNLVAKQNFRSPLPRVILFYENTFFSTCTYEYTRALYALIRRSLFA